MYVCIYNTKKHGEKKKLFVRLSNICMNLGNKNMSPEKGAEEAGAGKVSGML